MDMSVQPVCLTMLMNGFGDFKEGTCWGVYMSRKDGMPMSPATGSRAQGKTPEIDKITPDVIFQAGGHVKHEV